MTKRKNMKLENILKGLLTTLLGGAMMGFAFHGWYFEKIDPLSDWQAIILGTLGFALLFVRPKIEQTLGKVLGDIPSMIWAKFFGGKKSDEAKK